MKKTGLADSPFFETAPDKREALSPPSTPDQAEEKKRKKKQKRKEEGESEKTKDSKQPGNHGIKQPANSDTMQPRDHDTTVSRYHEAIIEALRKAVKEIGKEAATHRFTAEEKKAVADLIYTYQNQGLRTSENEITRIAVNFIIHDYRENGEESILERALKALNE